MTKVYINGKLYDKADAKISVYDHGFLYGDGIFEGIRVYGGKVFKLREHVERLYDSARHIGLEIPLDRAQMTEAVISHIHEAWQPQEFRIWRRLDAETGCAVEAMIRTGPQSAYGGSGPSRGVAVCRAALFLVGNRTRKRG